MESRCQYARIESQSPNATCETRVVLGSLRYIAYGFLIALLAGPASADDPPPSVGMAQQLEQVVLPGSPLEVKPLEDRHDPFVLRIVNMYPHGSDHRYDFEYYASGARQLQLGELLATR